MQKRDWVSIAAFIYLAIPLQIFVFTFLKNWLGIPLFLLFTYIIIRVIRYYSKQWTTCAYSRREIILGLIVIAFWVLLSGIGGYAFQNFDHDTRNSILKDLISYRWPVTYQQNNTTYGLVYYIGFWLPSALIGKWFGWQAGNFTLYIWTLIGVFITVLSIKKRLTSSLLFCSLFFIFFSGMDFLGVLFIKLLGVHGYPYLWPPISHLEWWAGFFQFSSFTTQLFWVFNQAIPCWVIMALIINRVSIKHLILLWGFALFYCPLPALGMIPYIFLMAMHQSNTSISSLKIRIEKKVWESILDSLKSIFSVENLFGGVPLILLGGIYYFSNKLTGSISLLNLDSTKVIIYFLFITFEAFLLILLVGSDYKNRVVFIFTSIILISSPLIIVGNDKDFTMRVSIPALFVLFVLTAEVLLTHSYQGFKAKFVIAVLLIGSLTPFYEISRSIYRTYKNNFKPKITVISMEPTTEEPVAFPPDYPLAEFAHPDSLTANVYQSLTYFDLETASNYVTKMENSIFYQWLAK